MEEYKLWLEKQIEKCLEDKDLQREHWAFCIRLDILKRQSHGNKGTARTLPVV